MSFLNYIRLLRRIPILLWLILIMPPGSAQIAFRFTAGEPVRFGVKESPGISYFWKVIENRDLKKGTETDRVIWLSGKYEPEVRLLWKTAGEYFIAVFVSDQKGCSNRKVYPVTITESHSPVAVDDYVSTDWLKSIRIDLVKNDHDAGNDLDTSSLSIVTKPEHGMVTHTQKGMIDYMPKGIRAVRDRFYYRICDFNNQCDSAIVSVDLKDPPLAVPQIISPNGDGINDLFEIKGLSAYPQSELTIYSRGGEIIFQSDDYQNDWAGVWNKGSYSNCQIPAGTYYYLFHPGGTARVIKGYIYIAR